MNYGIAYKDQNCKGFSDTEPYILYDFEDYQQARKQADRMIDNEFCSVIVFSFSGELPESVTWDFVKSNICEFDRE